MAIRPVPLVAAAFTAALLLAACNPGLSGGPAAGTGTAQGRIIALNDMSVLRTMFNRDAGHARLVLIFSPT